MGREKVKQIKVVRFKLYYSGNQRIKNGINKNLKKDVFILTRMAIA